MSQALPAASRRLPPSALRLPGSPSLWLPYLLYLLLAVAYLLAVPLGESPDEPGHLQCIGQVAALGRLPQIEPPPAGAWWSREAILSGRMCYHMPLYYLLTGGLQWLVQGSAPLPPLPPSHPEWNGMTAAPMFDHAGKTAWYVLDEAAVVTWMRLAGVLAGLAILGTAGRAARFLQPDQETAPRLALLLTAGWPQFLFMSRAISNDTLATALGAVALALLLDVGRPGRYGWLGCLACLAVLAKLTMVFLVGVLLLAFLTESLVVYRARARAYVWPGLILLGLLLALAALLWLQPTLRSHLRLSELSFTPVAGASQTLVYWQRVGAWTMSSGWARFGWMNLPAPQWQAVLWWGIIAGAGLSGLIFSWRAATTPARRWQVIVVVLWLVGLAVIYGRINLNRFQPQFRLIMAAVPALAALAAVGLARATAPWWRWQRRLPWLLAGGLLVSNAWLILTIIVPAYY